LEVVVVKVVKLAVFAALFEIVKVVPEVIIPAILGRDGAFGAWQTWT
jgi:hypothetical protein